MVRALGNIKAILQLIRWHNLVIVAITQILIRQCLLVPILKYSNLYPQLSILEFTLLVLSTVFITAGGYAINDYFDRKIDKVNKPGTLIVGRLIYPRHAMFYHWIFTGTGVILGLWLSVLTHLLYLGICFVLVSGLLWFYSTTYKRQLLLGNLMVALLTAMVPVIVLLFELPLLTRVYGSVIGEIGLTLKYLTYWVTGFALFAFLLTFAREIIKDAEDFEGDQAYGRLTLPVIMGMKVTRLIILFLLICVVALLILANISYIPDYFTLIYFIGLFILPILYVCYLVIRAKNKKLFQRASLMIKLVMIAGIAYMVIVNMLIRKFT